MLCRIISSCTSQYQLSYMHVKYLVDEFMCFCLLLLTSLVFAENLLSKAPGSSLVQGTSLDVKRWSTCAVFKCSLEELAFGRELLEEEASETNAYVVARSGLLNPPFELNKSHTTRHCRIFISAIS